MMDLKTQLYSIFFSFCFGSLFYFFVVLFKKFVYSKKIILEILSVALLSIFSCLIYFIIIKKINNGIIHFYFILSIIFGYSVSCFTVSKVKK